MLCATTACNFSSLIWPAGSAPAALARLLFDPPEPQIIGKKHSESRLSYLFAHVHLLASHSFSSLIFSLLDFSVLTLPTSAFPSLHIVGSLTSKLPSIKPCYTIINCNNDRSGSKNRTKYPRAWSDRERCIRFIWILWLKR